MHGWHLLAGFFLALLLAVPESSLAVNSISATHNGLLHTLQTDEQLYVLGDLVDVHYSVENITPDSLDLMHPQCGCPVWVTVFAGPDSVVWCNPCACADELCLDTLGPGESYVKEFTWDLENYWTGEPIESRGIHTVNGRLQVRPEEYEFELDLEITILGDATGLSWAETERTWCAIKSLYR